MTSHTVQFIGQTEDVTVKASASGEAEFGVTRFALWRRSDREQHEHRPLGQRELVLGCLGRHQPDRSSDVYLENQSSGGVGVPGTFTFAPKVKGIASYTYGFSDGTAVSSQPRAERPRSSGRPGQSGIYFLDVFGTTRDGTQLADYCHVFVN